MEHPCHKCGASVEDGVPFCKHCGVPQIRVPSGELVPPPPPKPSDNELPPFLAPGFPSLKSPSARSGGVSTINWSHALPRAAMIGVINLIAAPPLMFLGPIGLGLGFMLGGATTVMLYRRRVDNALPSVGAGGRIGAAMGGFSFFFAATFVIAVLVNRPEEMRQLLLDGLAQVASRGIDVQKVQQLHEILNRPDGLTSLMTALLLFLFVIFIGGASIGGALYAAWVRKRGMTL